MTPQLRPAARTSSRGSLKKRRPAVYVFGWPSFVGGADTKLAHLLRLLHGQLRITVIPNDPGQLEQRVWTRELDALGIRYSTLEQLPRRLTGFALSLCNDHFFT